MSEINILDLRTDDEREVDVIAGGLESQADDLDRRVSKYLKRTGALGATAIVAAGIALATHYYSEVWPYETDEAALSLTAYFPPRPATSLRRPVSISIEPGVNAAWPRSSGSKTPFWN